MRRLTSCQFPLHLIIKTRSKTQKISNAKRKGVVYMYTDKSLIYRDLGFSPETYLNAMLVAVSTSYVISSLLSNLGFCNRICKSMVSIYGRII